MQKYCRAKNSTAFHDLSDHYHATKQPNERFIVDLMDQIIKIVPYSYKEECAMKFAKIIIDSEYRAPEAKSDCWMVLMNVLPSINFDENTKKGVIDLVNCREWSSDEEN